jgi:8-oxo-dGTP pyrophosphatase MutT (NUDIX family)
MVSTAAAAPAGTQRKMFLELIDAVDSLPRDFDYGTFYALLLPDDARPHGFLAPSTVRALAPVFSANADVLRADHAARTVRVVTAPDAHAVSAALQPLADHIVAHDGDFHGITGGVHSERFRIVGAAYAGVHPTLERYPLPLFGCVSRGAHMTCFVRDVASPHGIRIWVAKRSASITTYPGMWDSTVAGGVKAEHTPLDCVAVEAGEEASIPEAEARRRAVAVGALTYASGRRHQHAGEQQLHYYRAPATVLYVFDMELAPDEVPRPGDDEVERFELWTVADVLDTMAAGVFKPNCCLVFLDFFIRRGILTPENCPEYVEIQMRMHRVLPVAMTPLAEAEPRDKTGQ